MQLDRGPANTAARIAGLPRGPRLTPARLATLWKEMLSASGVKQPLLADPAAARATSARFRSAARRLFLTAMPCRAKNGTARRGFQEFRTDLIGGVLLQWRSASAAWHWFASPVLCENVASTRLRN
jgi:hypothetical protein